MYEYKLNPAQKEFIEMPDHEYEIDVSLYQGGFGSGKTFSGSLLGIILCLKYAGIIGLVGAQTLGLVRDTTLVSYKEHFDRMGLVYGRDWTEQKSENKIVFSNGSTILFRHFEEPDKLKSLNLGFVELEEMSDIPQSTFDMLYSRLRQTKKKEWGPNFKYRLFGHTNPEERKGWIYRYFVENKQPNYRMVIAPTTDNEHNLPKGFVEGMRKLYTEEYFKRNVLGQFGDYATGLATKGFNRQDNLRTDIEINKNFPLHLTCDFNTDPMCWYIMQIYNNNVYILHELVECKTSTDYCARLMAELLKDFKNHKIIINGDAAGKQVTTTGQNYAVMETVFANEGFTNIEFEVCKSNPPITYRYMCWNNKIRNKDGKPELFIRPECKYLIYDIENLETKEGESKPNKPSGGKLRTDAYAKYLTHPTDACSYPVMMYFPIDREQIERPSSSFEREYTDVFGNKKYEYKIGL